MKARRGNEKEKENIIQWIIDAGKKRAEVVVF